MKLNQAYKGFRMWAVVILILLLQACGVYSFTGASIPPEAKTISVQYFPNKAQLVEPTLSSFFTDKMRNQFTRQTNLEMVDRNGDLAIEGEITEYKTTPVAIQGDQTSALNRLSITVNVRFVNAYEPDKDFEQKFTAFLDYPSDSDYNVVKDELFEGVTEILTTDIFNKAVINW